MLRQEGLPDVAPPHQKDHHQMVLPWAECRGVSVPIPLGLILQATSEEQFDHSGD